MLMRKKAEKQTPQTRQPSLAETYAGITPAKLVLLFAIGCFAGFVLETIFTFFNKGYIESRRGMIYGPFNQVYGFGMVIMILLLTPLAQAGNRTLFFGSAIIGGAFEFLCSFLQEKVIGTVSWEYSDQTFSFGGRTSLIFMLYWGILGLMLMRIIYPYTSQKLDRIPHRLQAQLSAILAVFLSVNMLLSLAAVMRWHERLDGRAPSNAVEIFLDEHYPNDRLEAVYPTMMRVGRGETSSPL